MESKPKPKLKRQTFGANESGSNGLKRFRVIAVLGFDTNIMWFKV
jgi:hypothetical protein